MSLHELKLAILELAASSNRVHKITLIGRPRQAGDLERHFARAFDAEDRARAGQAFDQLRSDGLLRPDYADLADPENWIEITPQGKESLRLRACDPLDKALAEISSHLVEIRAGAWAAASSRRPDAVRQAAHSGRELIEQVLKEGAPDQQVRARPWFQPNPNAKGTDITRKHRLKFLMETRRSNLSESDLEVAMKADELVLAVDKKLQALSHERMSSSAQDVTDSLRAAEIALRRILLPSDPLEETVI
jgi:DNA-binding PadR family transcriptional regulator